MIEVYVNPKFRNESSIIRERFRKFNYFQLVDPDNFKDANRKNEVMFANNPFGKRFPIYVN